MKRQIEVRPAQSEDEEFLMDLRNDPSVIAAGDSGRPADPSWLEGMIDVIWMPVGYVRLDRTREGVEVSIALTPEARGQNIGTEALIETRAKRYQKLPLYARVKRNNPASLRAFRKAGFVEDRETKTHVIFRMPR